jgi:hypothetical protein
LRPWFNECGREEGDTKVADCIEGTVTFEDLEVLGALHSRGARLSVEAQDGTLSWRRYVRNTVMISGSGGPGTGLCQAV